MTIGEIVREGLHYARTCRSLWLFGFFVGLSGGSSNGGGGGGGHGSAGSADRDADLHTGMVTTLSRIKAAAEAT